MEVKTEGLNAKEVSNKVMNAKDVKTEGFVPIKDSNYFVVSNGEAPFRIYFTINDAMNAGCEYIDAFDAVGNRTVSYKRGVVGYTTDF